MCEDDRRLDDYFEIFKDLIIRYAKSYVGDYYIAEDICQETFIRFGEHQDEIRESSAKFWLMKTAKNIALDYLRKSKNRVPVIDLDTALDMIKHPSVIFMEEHHGITPPDKPVHFTYCGYNALPEFIERELPRKKRNSPYRTPELSSGRVTLYLKFAFHS